MNIVLTIDQAKLELLVSALGSHSRCLADEYKRAYSGEHIGKFFSRMSEKDMDDVFTQMEETVKLRQSLQNREIEVSNA